MTLFFLVYNYLFYSIAVLTWGLNFIYVGFLLSIFTYIIFFQNTFLSFHFIIFRLNVFYCVSKKIDYLLCSYKINFIFVMLLFLLFFPKTGSSRFNFSCFLVFLTPLSEVLVFLINNLLQ